MGKLRRDGGEGGGGEGVEGGVVVVVVVSGCAEDFMSDYIGNEGWTKSQFHNLMSSSGTHKIILLRLYRLICLMLATSVQKILACLPAKWLCDASSMLVGVWLLVTLCFQPSPLASKLLAAPRKGEQSVSLSLPVHSLSTASPMQCLLVAAGVYGCRKAPEPNCKGEITIN